MIPFMAAGLLVLYAVNAGANAMMQCEFSTANLCSHLPFQQPAVPNNSRVDIFIQL